MEHVNHRGAPAPGPDSPERPALTPESATPGESGQAVQGGKENGQGDGIGAAADAQITPTTQKADATLQARAALAGFELVKLPDGYVISRWGESKHLADPAAVHAFLVRVGAPS